MFSSPSSSIFTSRVGTALIVISVYDVLLFFHRELLDLAELVQDVLVLSGIVSDFLEPRLESVDLVLFTFMQQLHLPSQKVLVVRLSRIKNSLVSRCFLLLVLCYLLHDRVRVKVSHLGS